MSPLLIGLAAIIVIAACITLLERETPARIKRR